MDPAEEIVGMWLQKHGFFTMSNVTVGYRRKEIDFLAVNPIAGRKAHVEVHASVFPLGPLRAWGPVKYGIMSIDERVKHYYNKKFVGATVKGTGELLNRCVEDAVKEKLGDGEYEKWLVFGTLHQKDHEDQVRREFQKHGVKVFLIRDILKEIPFEGVARDPTGRFLQLLASQLSKEARVSLLGQGRVMK